MPRASRYVWAPGERQRFAALLAPLCEHSEAARELSRLLATTDVIKLVCPPGDRPPHAVAGTPADVRVYEANHALPGGFAGVWFLSPRQFTPAELAALNAWVIDRGLSPPGWKHPVHQSAEFEDHADAVRVATCRPLTDAERGDLFAWLAGRGLIL